MIKSGNMTGVILIVLCTLFSCDGSLKKGTFEEAMALHEAEKYKEAVKIFGYLAKEERNPKAAYNLGVCYINGYGVKSDYNRGLEMMLLAQALGETRAYYVLGWLAENGYHEKGPDGKEMTIVNCHPAIVTCTDGWIWPAIWWYVKSVASGNAGDIKHIISFYYRQGAVAEQYAWAMLGVNLGVIDKNKADEVEQELGQEHASVQERAKGWAARLIELYGRSDG